MYLDMPDDAMKSTLLQQATEGYHSGVMKRLTPGQLGQVISLFKKQTVTNHDGHPIEPTNAEEAADIIRELDAKQYNAYINLIASF